MSNAIYDRKTYTTTTATINSKEITAIVNRNDNETYTIKEKTDKNGTKTIHSPFTTKEKLTFPFYVTTIAVIILSTTLIALISVGVIPIPLPSICIFCLLIPGAACLPMIYLYKMFSKNHRAIEEIAEQTKIREKRVREIHQQYRNNNAPQSN